MADLLKRWWTSWRDVIVVVVVLVIAATLWHQYRQRRDHEYSERRACEIVYGAGNCVKNADGHWVAHGS